MYETDIPYLDTMFTNFSPSKRARRIIEAHVTKTANIPIIFLATWKIDIEAGALSNGNYPEFAVTQLALKM